MSSFNTEALASYSGGHGLESAADYPNRALPPLPLVASSKCWDITPKQATTAWYHVLSNSSFTVTLPFGVIQPMQLESMVM